MTAKEAILKYSEMIREATGKAEDQGWSKEEVFDFLFNAIGSIEEELLKDIDT